MTKVSLDLKSFKMGRLRDTVLPYCRDLPSDEYIVVGYEPARRDHALVTSQPEQPALVDNVPDNHLRVLEIVKQ